MSFYYRYNQSIQKEKKIIQLLAQRNGTKFPCPCIACLDTRWAIKHIAENVYFTDNSVVLPLKIQDHC